MSVRCAAFAVVAALVVGFTPGPASAAARGSCASKGSRTLASSDALRAYRRSGHVYVCSRATGKRARMDFGRRTIRIDDARGPYLAYVERDPDFSNHGGAFDWIRVIDVRRPGLVLESGAFSNASDETTVAEVGQVTLLSGGAVAWIARNTAQETRPFEVLVKRPRSIGVQLLDSSPAIELDSLAVSRRYLYWTRSGAPQRASATR
jgi:hypothetical protein